MEGKKNQILLIYILGTLFVILGGVGTATDIFRHQFNFPILLDLIAANGSMAAVGVIAVLVARILGDLDESITRIEIATK
jgi:hypothetical protein